MNARQLAKRKALDELRWAEYREAKKVYEENMLLFMAEYEEYNNEMAEQAVPLKPASSAYKGRGGNRAVRAR